jgi:hypothetical protein
LTSLHDLDSFAFAGAISGRRLPFQLGTTGPVDRLYPIWYRAAHYLTRVLIPAAVL